MWNQKKWYKWTYLQNRVTDGENKLTVTSMGKGGRGINWVIGNNIHILLHMKKVINKEPLYSAGNFSKLCNDLSGKSESEVAQSCPTLSDPMDCSLPGCSIQGIFQARVLEWIAITFSTIWEKHLKKRGYMYIYNWFTLLYSRN